MSVPILTGAGTYCSDLIETFVVYFETEEYASRMTPLWSSCALVNSSICVNMKRRIAFPLLRKSVLAMILLVGALTLSRRL